MKLNLDIDIFHCLFASIDNQENCVHRICVQIWFRILIWIPCNAACRFPFYSNFIEWYWMSVYDIALRCTIRCLYSIQSQDIHAHFNSLHRLKYACRSILKAKQSITKSLQCIFYCAHIYYSILSTLNAIDCCFEFIFDFAICTQLIVLF